LGDGRGGRDTTRATPRAARAAIAQPGDLEDNMIRAQTRLTVRRPRRTPLLRRLIVTDGLRIVGGHHNLDTGVVQVIA
jgi:hypothetical protein